MASRNQDERQCLPATAFWNKALEALRPDDREQLLSTPLGSLNSLDDLLSDIRTKRDMAHSKRWKFKRSDGTTIIVRDVFEKILGCVSRYTKSIDILANADPVHAGLPWDVCRFLLQVSTSDLEAFGSLSEGIEVVAGVLYRYRILEDVCLSPLPSPRDDALLYLGGCIVKVYTAVLNYLATAKKYWSHNTASRIARSLVRDMEAERQTLQSVVSTADEEAIKTANLFQMRELYDISEATKKALTTVVDDLRGPLMRVAQDVSHLHDQLQQQERQEVFRWLSTVPCEAHHKQSCKKILDGTGRWLLESPTFLDWQKSSASALFWLNGTPGSGKSKLTSIVIQSLLEKQTLAQSQNAPLAYFYCSQKSTDPRTADSREILCALLRQLTSSDSATPLRGTVGEDFRQRKETADNNGAQIAPLDIEETVEHILAITKEDSATIILDALDEVDEERSDLFDALERIVQASDNVVKVFVSSRRDGDIVERFDQCARVRTGDHMSKHDMERFIQHKVTEAITTRKMLRGKVSPSLRDDIIRTLTERAGGMFRWVELSVEMLANSKHLSVERDVRSKLGQLPATLKQQYAMIYQDILESEPSTATIAQRVFSWLLAAQRVLTIEEVLAAVALDDDGYYHHDLDVSRLLDICRNLIVVVSTDDQSSTQSFQVAHLSVKEYLTETTDFSTERIHTRATLRCFQAFDPQSMVRKSFSPRLEHGKDPMHGYTIYLFEHAQRSELTRSRSSQATIMKEFLFDKSLKPTKMLQEWIRSIENLFEDYIQLKDSEDLLLFRLTRQEEPTDHLTDNGLYYLCRYGLLSVLQSLEPPRVHALLSRKVYSSSSLQRSPLFIATKFRKLAVAQWLLQKGITGADEADSDLPPLSVAVLCGELEIVNLLLSYGADPLSRGEIGYSATPWHRVFTNRHLEIFQSLLDAIERMHTTNSRPYEALKFNWKNEALFDALFCGWTAVVSILIGRGADIFSKTTRQDYYFHKWRRSTTLQVAVAYAEFTTIQTLLEAAERQVKVNDSSCTDTWMNALDHLGRSTLHCLMDRDITMSHDDEAMMGLLIAHGVNPDMSDVNGLTALHVAASIGSLSTLQDLQKRDLDLGARAHDGATVLHIAAGGRCSSPSLVQYLVEEGLGPLDRDHEGKTTLHYAVASCNTVALGALIEVLRRTGYSDELHSHTPLKISVSASSEKFVNKETSILQTAIDCTDFFGNTLLHAIGRKIREVQINGYGAETLDKKKIQVKSTTHLLLDLALDIDKRNTAGETPVLALLGYDYGVFAAEILLTRGADAKIPDWNGRTPLHVAARSGWIEAMQLLLQAGVDIEAKDCKLCTPLHVASHFQKIRILLQNKANPGSKDVNGATPLHYACKNFYTDEGIKMLAKANADVNAVDNSGSTAMHWAAAVGYAETVSVLLNMGADPNVLNLDGESAMEVAARHASTVTEEDFSFGRDFLKVWHHLYHASEKQKPGTKLRLREHTLTRSRSLILRTDHTWGDFSHVRAEEIAHGNGELFTRPSPSSSTLSCDDAVATSQKHCRDLYRLRR